MSQQTDGTSEPDSRARLVEELCARRGQFVAIFAFAVVFLLLSVLYAVFADPDSSLYAVVVLNLIGSLVFVLGSGSVLWLCTRRG